MGIKVGLIYYNEVDFISMTLKSLEGKVDEILAVDGKILGFPGRGRLSSDGSTAIIEEAGGRIVSGGLWKTEMDKRQVYIDKANNGDQIFIIDADEILKGTLPIVSDFYVISAHSFYESSWRLRLIKKTDTLHYGTTHWQLLDDDHDYHKRSCEKELSEWKAGEIYHLDLLRSHPRQMQKITFNVIREDEILLRRFADV